MFIVNLNYRRKVKYRKCRKNKKHQKFIEIPLLLKGYTSLESGSPDFTIRKENIECNSWAPKMVLRKTIDFFIKLVRKIYITISTIDFNYYIFFNVTVSFYTVPSYGLK